MSYVVITGASCGVGKELAFLYAKKGYNLVLVARNKDKLDIASNEIKAQYNVEIECYSFDLCKEYQEFFMAVTKDNKDIAYVINNAGVGYAGEFLSHDIAKEMDLIDLNVKALTYLTHSFGNYMKKQQHGTIVEISSIGSMMGGPYIASYYASKAYVTSFSLSLSYELRRENVFVCVMNLPRVNTEFDSHAGRNKRPGKGMRVEKVAKKIYRRAKKNKRLSNIGFTTKIVNILTRILPKRIFLSLIGQSLEE